jgi:Ice-binding-like
MKNKLLNFLTLGILFLIPSISFGQAPNLGAASNFALFTAAGAINVTGAGTIVTGDVGTNAGAFNAFLPGTLIGTSHVADAVSAQAATDVALAYGSISPIPCGPGGVIGVGLGGGQTLTPNVYCLGGASTLTGALTLDGQGNPNAIFIFKINGALSTAVNSSVTLINGASLCNVYWQINGAVALETGTVFQGNILAAGAISLLGNATLLGRGLTTMGAISAANNTVTLGIPPVASTIIASGATSFCAGGSVVLSGNVGGTWSTGATTPTITVTTSGDYFVTNTSGCRSVISNHIIVTVNPLPAANAGNNATICSGNSVMIGAAPVAGSTYSWTPATGLSSTTIANPIASPAATTTYTLTETITATGCQRMNSVTVSVGSPATCTITGNSTICQVGSTMLCVPAGAVSYLWSANALNATMPCVTVTAAGTYTVTVTVAAGCTNICSQTVTVDPLPIASIITGPTSFCAGGSVTLSGNVGGTWSTGATTPSITVTVAGDYFVTNTNACGSVVSNHIIVTVNALPICTITGNGSVCTGQTTQLCAPASSAGNPLTYLWNTGATTDCITVGAGAYSVVVTNASGCMSICSKVISVNPPPTAITGSNAVICNGFSVTLGTAPIAGHTYLWTPATGLSSATIANPVAGPSVTTTYTLIETITATGCQMSNSVTVTVDALTIVGVSAICPGKSAQLCATPGFSSYLWSTGETTSCIIVTRTDTYYLTVGGCGTRFGHKVSVIVPSSCDCECK